MVPFVMAIWYSLTNYSLKLPNHRFIGLENWVNVLSSPDFWQALKVSLLYGIVATAVEMALGLGVAILLNNLNNGLAKVLRVLLVFPLMVAPVTATIVWQLMLNSSVGIVEKFLNVFGVYNFCLLYTSIDESARSFDQIYVSGGRIGISLKLNPEELARLIDAQFRKVSA